MGRNLGNGFIKFSISTKFFLARTRLRISQTQFTAFILVTYYGYVEVCKNDMCYAIRNMNVTHEKDGGKITVVHSSPVALLDEFVSFAELQIDQSNTITQENNIELYQVHIEIRNIDPDDSQKFMSLFYIRLEQNTELMYVKTGNTFEELPLDETQWNCSVKETVNMKLCFCKRSYPLEFCSNRSLSIFNPMVIPNFDTTRVTLRQTTKGANEPTLITSSGSLMTELDELLQLIQKLLHIETILDEDTNAVLLAMDRILDTNSLAQVTSSRFLNFLDYLMKHSCCDIYFVGNHSFSITRQSVNCATTNKENWPVLRDDLIKSDHLLRNRFGASVWIPYETVCYRNTSHEHILAYFMFYNRALFVENQPVSDNCELNLHTQTNFPVLGAQLINNSNEVHQIFTNGEYMPMANIMFNREEMPSPLHGLLKLAHWNSEKWSYTENTKMKVNEEKYIWEVNHLTDFTLVVDGIDMDPILCDIFLDYISMGLNCASSVSLLILTLITIRQRFSGTKSKYNHFQRIMSRFYGIRISYYISLTCLHFGFAMLSDSRRLFWPFTCEIAAVILYWLLLVCTLTTALQSMKLYKTVVKTSVIERILNKLTSTKSALLLILGIPSCSTLILIKFLPKFYIRRDTFCWVRPDYVVPAVILPVGILGLCATCCFVIIFIRYVLQEQLFGVSLQRGASSVKTIVRGSLSANCKSNKVSNMDTWLKYFDKASVMLCMQLMLGLPWICQYFTLFVPHLTAAHYIFTVAIGSQGLMLMMLYCSRRIKDRYTCSNCKR